MRKASAWLILIALGIVFAWQLWGGDLGSRTRHAEGEGSRQGGVAAGKELLSDDTVRVVPGEAAEPQGARVNASDANALAGSFKQSNDCLLYHSARRELEYFLGDERLDDLSGRSLETLEGIDATSRKYISILWQTEASCAGSDQTAMALAYADAVLKAALSGNPDAQSCFVIGAPPPLPKGAASGESWQDRYLRYAPVFTEHALQRVDPYVAARALYQHIASPSLHPSKMDELKPADPYLTYRAARLASLRALPAQRARLEGSLAAFKELNLLGPKLIEQADAWASAAYTRDYAEQPPLDLDSHAPCYSSPGLAP